MTDYRQKYPLSFWLLSGVIVLGLLPAAAMAAPPTGEGGPQAKPTTQAQRSAQQTKKKRKKKLKRKRRSKAEKEPVEEATEAPEDTEPKVEGAEEADVQAAATAGVGMDSKQGGSVRRSNKMEFDARLIRGETAGSGAVILFDRGHRELPSLTKKRTRFLDQTLEEVYKPESQSQAKTKPAAKKK